MGCLNAKIDFKSSEIAGNESKIKRRNNNFDNNFNCSLFLISAKEGSALLSPAICSEEKIIRIRVSLR